ncbi:MAG: hypothetical protein BGO01_14905 [Armatimonadetes bacterium 55-13]|nr:alpha/beta hydrolase [Armatimonadota bacterium]OJU64993.1 MAG: hypothetical protein BGO01_14905 [Armatimonadetes bacterium 55-13]
MISTLLVLALSARVDLGVVYSKVSGETLRMDIYAPQPMGKRVPAVVVIHGGAWIGGSREGMASLCRRLSEEGILAATIDYRLAPKYRWPAFYDDAQTAVRFLRANAKKYRIQADKIGACGSSAGGHLALLLGFTDTRETKPLEHPGYSSRVMAVLDMFGPTDMSRDFPKSYDSLFMAVLGKPRSSATAEIRAASPVSYLDARSSPVFIIHGLDDPVVPVAQSKWLESKLRALRIATIARYVPGMKHEISSTNSRAMEAMSEGLTWLKGRLSLN